MNRMCPHRIFKNFFLGLNISKSDSFYIRDHSFSTYTKQSEKYFLLRACAYQRVRNVSFSENFGYMLNEWLLIWEVFIYKIALRKINFTVLPLETFLVPREEWSNRLICHYLLCDLILNCQNNISDLLNTTRKTSFNSSFCCQAWSHLVVIFTFKKDELCGLIYKVVDWIDINLSREVSSFQNFLKEKKSREVVQIFPIKKKAEVALKKRGYPIIYFHTD